MELGELIKVPLDDQPVEDECPFSHEKPNPNEKNELGGVGTKLGENLANGKGVHKSKPPIGGDFTTGPVEKDPRDVRPNAITCVYFKVKGEQVTLNGKPLPYPLTCAAHHLIPAQESLKDSPILNYMCKEGEDQDFMKGGDSDAKPVPGSKVWGNVAYNVNGGQNGVWLPGNYAVGAGPGGVEVWKSKASDKRKTYSDEEAADNWERALDLGSDEWKQNPVDPVECEKPQKIALAMKTSADPIFMLAGTNYHIDDGNPKWAYVKAAMDKAGGLFHDRHKVYSGEVQTYLKKIAEAYNTMYESSTDDKNPCQKCEEAERPKGAKTDLVGPPYGIVSRLVSGSNFFKKYVKTQTVTARNIYTSNWILAWMDTKK